MLYLHLNDTFVVWRSSLSNGHTQSLQICDNYIIYLGLLCAIRVRYSIHIYIYAHLKWLMFACVSVHLVLLLFIYDFRDQLLINNELIDAWSHIGCCFSCNYQYHSTNLNDSWQKRVLKTIKTLTMCSRNSFLFVHELWKKKSTRAKRINEIRDEKKNLSNEFAQSERELFVIFVFLHCRNDSAELLLLFWFANFPSTASSGLDFHLLEQ